MLTAHETRQLDRLALAASTAAPAAGSRHARARGYGLEFEDYRHYQAGDDPRSIDWTVDARLRQLVVRVFRAEGHVRLHLLVDVSRSMTIGLPSKLACATRLAAALSYVAIERRDAVALATFDDRVRTRVAVATGKPQLFRVLDLLASLAPMGRSALDHALVAYATAVRGPGLAVVLSDFVGSDQTLEGLRYLQYRGLIPAVVQILADEDIDPGIDEETEIRDVEDPTAPPLVVDAAAVRGYQERLDRVTRELQTFCRERGFPWLRVTASTTFGDMLQACVQAGILAPHA
jgi:uncharacterized protein (DUF58 family)